MHNIDILVWNLDQNFFLNHSFSASFRDSLILKWFATVHLMLYLYFKFLVFKNLFSDVKMCDAQCFLQY